jgi:hypothetical protein
MFQSQRQCNNLFSLIFFKYTCFLFHCMKDFNSKSLSWNIKVFSFYFDFSVLYFPNMQLLTFKQLNTLWYSENWLDSFLFILSNILLPYHPIFSIEFSQTFHSLHSFSSFISLFQSDSKNQFPSFHCKTLY